MVGLVLVSHSHTLAEAVKRLVISMTGEELPVAVAAGSGENHDELGTDAMEILSAIQTTDSGEGVVVLMDMGSAVLSAETALDFLDEAQRSRAHLCAAPFVEGAVAAGVSAKLGNSPAEIIREATGALGQKQQHLPQENPTTEITSPQPTANSPSATARVTIPNELGIHARPAARLAQEAGRYHASILLRNVTSNKGPVPARSLTGLITLEARRGHEIEISASGPEETQAVQNLREFIASGMGDSLTKTAASAEPLPTTLFHPNNETARHAIGISKGIAVGPLFFAEEKTPHPPEALVSDTTAEKQKLRAALSAVRRKYQDDAVLLKKNLGQDQAEIFVAQTLVLEDPTLVEQAESRISQNKDNAAHAWWQAIQKAVAAYKQLDDPLLRQRAADLNDVAAAVLHELGVAGNEPLEIPEPGILVVRDLTPGQVTQLDTNRIHGVICLEGGKTSHSAILLRTRGIPAIAHAAFVKPPLASFKGRATVAILWGETGEIQINPNSQTLDKIQRQQKELTERALHEKEACHQPALTRRGRHVSVFANVGSLDDARSAFENGADGIGLLRTEFLFLHRTTPPTEAEQVESLRAIARALPDKPVVVRTLDAGGDKELPYLAMPKEDNPFLGVRAIRLCLQQRDLFHTQLRSILQAATIGDLRVMFPMIATLDELSAAKEELELAHRCLKEGGIPHLWPIPTGMMMEVPSAALLADEFAPLVDFFSIGTNDLTQYTLAADRGNTALQGLDDPLHPAVISLIHHVTRAAEKAKISVSVCGEAAADPKAADVFLQLGVDELSMNSRSIPATKQWVRGLDL